MEKRQLRSGFPIELGGLTMTLLGCNVLNGGILYPKSLGSIMFSMILFLITLLECYMSLGECKNGPNRDRLPHNSR